VNRLSIWVSKMHGTRIIFLLGVAALAASLSEPALAMPTALALQQSQASERVLEPIGHRWYRRHVYRYPYYYRRPYYGPYAYYRPYYQPYYYPYYRPYYRPGVSFWFGF